MSPRLAQQLGPELVGRRVVLRRRLPDGSAGDLLGELVRWDGSGAQAAVTVRTDRGDVTVPVGDVLGGKPVPPRPARRGRPHRTIGWTDLEDIATDGWQAVETERLGDEPGWLLRASDGFTSRANSVLALGDPGLPLSQALDRAEDWYRARSLPPRFAIAWPLSAVRAAEVPGTSPNPRAAAYARGVDTDLDRALVAREYRLDTPTLVLTAATREVQVATTPPHDPRATPGVRVDDEPDEAWLGVYHYRGRSLPPVARRLLMSAPAQAFASARDAAGRTVAVGRAASSRGWTGITAMEVVPEARRQGLARQVLRALADWADTRGDPCLYLQVAVGNDPARALYDSVGFGAHHGYHYRVLDAATR